MTEEGNGLIECKAAVMERRDDALILDRSVMHAQGGGQPSDTGTITGPDGSCFQVSKVMLDRETGVSTHLGSSEHGTVAVGDEVQVKVNRENRQLLSECHSGKLPIFSN